MINMAFAAVLACAVYFISNTVEAAEIKILCASGMREVISELQPQLMRLVGQQVSISFGEAGDLRKRTQGGEIADVTVLPRIVLDEVMADSNIVPGTIIDMAQSSIGMGVRKNGPKPDISSANKFKQSLCCMTRALCRPECGAADELAAMLASLWDEASVERWRPRRTHRCVTSQPHPSSRRHRSVLQRIAIRPETSPLPRDCHRDRG